MALNDTLSHFTPPPHPKGIVLAGTDVVLRPVSVADHAADLFAANSEDSQGAIWEYLPYGPFPTLCAYETWLGSQEAQQDPAFFAIIRRSDDRAVGLASFLRIDQANGSIEVGHINFAPPLQRTRAGTEAMVLMMQWAFENGYRRYEWKCNALNRKSRHAAQRLGLSYEGVFRQMSIVKGRNRDTAWFAAIDSEWPALKGAFQRYLDPQNFDAQGRPIVALSALTQPLLFKRDDLAFA